MQRYRILSSLLDPESEKRRLIWIATTTCAAVLVILLDFTYLDIKEMLGILSGKVDKFLKTIFYSLLFSGLTMEWHFPLRIWIKIIGLEVAQPPEGTVGGGSMDVA